MAGTGPLDLHALAEEFLTACCESLDTISSFGTALSGCPDRVFVAPGQPVIDCEQLTVHVGSIGEREATVKPIGRVTNVTLIATIARCCFPYPTPNAPSAEDQAWVAEQINADKWALWNHLYFMVMNGLLFEQCCEVIWNSLNSLFPSGGCGGSVLTVSVCFDGYEELLGT